MAIFFAALALVVLLLSLPVELEFDAKWPETDRNRADLRWAFGLVNMDLRRGGEEAAQTPADAASIEPAPDPDKPKKRTRIRSLRSMLADPALRRRLMRFVRDCWRAVRKEDVRLECRIGLDEPADTGVLWGALGPIAAGLQTVRDCEILLTPEFLRESFEFAAAGKIKLYPIQFGGLFAGLLASPRIWRGLLARGGAS